MHANRKKHSSALPRTTLLISLSKHTTRISLAAPREAPVYFVFCSVCFIFLHPPRMQCIQSLCGGIQAFIFFPI